MFWGKAALFRGQAALVQRKIGLLCDKAALLYENQTCGIVQSLFSGTTGPFGERISLSLRMGGLRISTIGRKVSSFRSGFPVALACTLATFPARERQCVASICSPGPVKRGRISE
jgi:hypothetical protein